MAESNPGNLPSDVAAFLYFLETRNIDFCLVGGIALLAYVDDRNTKDIDLIISVADLERVRPFIVELAEDEFFLNAQFNNLRVDFLKTARRIFEWVKENFVERKVFVEGVIPTATPEGLIILKFDALFDLYRRGDFNKVLRYETDIAVLAQNYAIDWQAVWTTLGRFFDAGVVAKFQKIAADLLRRRSNPFGKI